MTPADLARAKAEVCRRRADGCERTSFAAGQRWTNAGTPEGEATAMVERALSEVRCHTWVLAALEFDALAAELDALATPAPAP